MPKQKGFQLLGAKKRRLAKANLMALVKNRLRITMTDERLSALGLLSVESDLLDNISFSDIIDTICVCKKQKVSVNQSS